MDGDVKMAVAVEPGELTATVAREGVPEVGCGDGSMIQDDGGTQGNSR